LIEREFDVGQILERFCECLASVDRLFTNRFDRGAFFIHLVAA